jgi:hypothetical protein
MHCDLIGCGIPGPYKRLERRIIRSRHALGDILRAPRAVVPVFALCLTKSEGDRRHTLEVVSIWELLRFQVIVNSLNGW